MISVKDFFDMIFDMMASAKWPLDEGAKISQGDAITQVLADKAHLDKT
jgi:hypothetical protein